MKNLADSYIDMARELGDLDTRYDLVETADSKHASVVSLGTIHDPSVGIFGGPVTPWFETEAELNDYCRKVICGEMTDGELAEYLAEVTE